jgi:hypothetical protein
MCLVYHYCTYTDVVTWLDVKAVPLSQISLPPVLFWAVLSDGRLTKLKENLQQNYAEMLPYDHIGV